jgi:two-component system, cell cycle response regulator
MSDQNNAQKTVFDEHTAALPGVGDAAELRPSLLMLEGGDTRIRYRIENEEMAIGRDLDCAISIHDSKVSRIHAKVNFFPGGSPSADPKFILTDLGSTNGTYVNGERISQIELRHRDRIAIGSFVFGFYLRDELPSKLPASAAETKRWDELTGLLNRELFESELEICVRTARERNQEMGLIVFEINQFKKLRETYGYQVGYEVLREMGQLVRQNCRTHDIGARYGGEQFAIILPDTPMERALVQADRLRKAAMAYVVPTDDTAIGISISAGLAPLEARMNHSRDLIAAAERALDRARSSGRNQVCWYRNNVEMRLDSVGV